MRSSLFFIFFLTSFQFFAKIPCYADSACTVFCVCDIWLGLKRATCSNKGFLTVEIGISTVIEISDLSNNSISSLQKYELAAAGYDKHKYLILSGNKIKVIDLSAFARLNDLAVLDLSRNLLTYILPDTFVRNMNLKILLLSHNNFSSHFPKLSSCTVTVLDLSDCFISELPADAFDYLKKLEYVNLSRNKLTVLHYQVFQRLPLIKTVLLQGNSWSCNRVTEMAENYLKSRKINFFPLCEIESIQTERLIEAQHEKLIVDCLSNLEPQTERFSFDNDHYEQMRLEILKKNSVLNISENLQLSRENIVFLLIGFLVGSGVTLIMWYFASRNFCKRRKKNNLESRQSNSQRNSLLRILPNSNSSSPICPGTPPPAYREIIRN